MKEELNLEEKLIKLIKLLECKDYLVSIYDQEQLNEIYIDLDEIDDKEDIEKITEKIKEMNTQYRFYIEEIFNYCEKYLVDNFVPYIKLMVNQQGICINYNNKIYIVRKFKGVDFVKCECYSLREYGKGNGYINEIKDEVQLTINENTISPIFIKEETRKKSIEYKKQEQNEIQLKIYLELEKINNSINKLRKIGLSNKEIENEIINELYKGQENTIQKVKTPKK